jgi:hypothetical protein
MVGVGVGVGVGLGGALTAIQINFLPLLAHMNDVDPAFATALAFLHAPPTFIEVTAPEAGNVPSIMLISKKGVIKAKKRFTLGAYK